MRRWYLALVVLTMAACGSTEGVGTRAPDASASPRPTGSLVSSLPPASASITRPGDAPSPSTAGLPSFAPTEPLVAYNRLTGAGGGLFVSKPDGSGLTQLATDILPGVHKRISWSPTGDRIAFIDEKTERLWIAHLDGSPTERVTACDTPGCDYPAFSPDGNHIAFSRTGPLEGFTGDGPGTLGIYVVDLESGAVTEVVVLKRPDLADEPTWSPDGRRIAFQRETMDERAFDTGSAVAIVPTAGGEATLLTDPTSYGTAPDWSWARDEVTFSSQLNDNVPSPSPGLTSDVWVVRPDGTGLRQVTNVPPSVRMLGPRWTPDGTRILAFDTSRGAVAIDPSTGAMEDLPTPSDFSRPVVRPLPR